MKCIFACIGPVYSGITGTRTGTHELGGSLRRPASSQASLPDEDLTGGRVAGLAPRRQGLMRRLTRLAAVLQVKVCVLTAMERDHLEALGGTIESIALAKAGIFKRRGSAVMARQPFPEAASVALELAASIECDVRTCEGMVTSPSPIQLEGVSRTSVHDPVMHAHRPACCTGAP